MDSLLPIGVAAASIGLTYIMCIRPMRRGHCAMMPASEDACDSPEDVAEIARLRAEIATLRQEPSHDPAGRHPTAG